MSLATLENHLIVGAILAEESRMESLIDQLTMALCRPGKVDPIISRASAAVIELAVNELDELDTALIQALTSLLDAGTAIAAVMHRAIRDYAEHHQSELLDHFHLTEADRAYDEALDRGECAA